MLNDREKQFIAYWEENRLKEKKLLKQLMVGIPVGLLFATPVLISVFSSRFWYKRADAVAISQVNPVVLIIAVLAITAFVAIFHKRHQWEMREQQYLELKGREREEDAATKTPDLS